MKRAWLLGATLAAFAAPACALPPSIANGLAARYLTSRLYASPTTYAVSTAAGATIGTLSKPFGAGTTYATVGTAPGQLSLSGSAIVAGSTAAATGGVYSLKVRAISADATREVAETLTFSAFGTPGGPTPNFLATVSTSPAADYSLMQLTAAATKAAACAAISDTSSAPTTTYDVTFNGDGTPNTTACTTAFGASFALWKLYDQSGNGYDAVQATSTSRGIVNTAASDGALYWTNQCCGTAGTTDSPANYTIPAALTTSRQALTMVAVAGGNDSTSNITQLNNGGLALITAGSTDATSSAQMVTSDGGLASRTNAGGYSLLPMGSDLTAMAERLNATNIKYFRNAESTTGTAPTAATGMTGGSVGGALFSNFQHSDGTRQLAYAIYPAALSDADVGSVLTSLETIAKISLKATQVVMDGDSIMRGVGSQQGQNEPWNLRSQLTGRPYIGDVAIGGATCVGDAGMHPQAWFTGLYQAAYGKNAFIEECSSNDVNGNYTAAQIESALMTLIQRAQTAGFNVGIKTPIPRSFTSAQNTVLNAVIAWEQANTNLGYTLINTNGVSGITYADNSDSTTPGTHPDNAGYKLIANYDAPIINTMLTTAAPVLSSGVTVSGSLTVGSTLTAGQGSYTNSPSGYSYVWTSAGAQVGTGSTYVIQSSDAGNAIAVRELASNAGGIATSSATAGTVPAAPTLSALTLSPTTSAAGSAWTSTISGATAGSTIAASSSDGTTLSVSGTGTTRTVTGTFSTAGSPTVTLTETLSGATNTPKSSTATVTVSAAQALAISGTPAGGTVGSVYSYTPTVSGGSGTRSFAASGTALPPVLSISSTTGAITGTPTAAATTSGIVITVTDSSGSTSQTVSIAIAAASASVTADSTKYTADSTAITADHQ